MEGYESSLWEGVDNLDPKLREPTMLLRATAFAETTMQEHFDIITPYYDLTMKEIKKKFKPEPGPYSTVFTILKGNVRNQGLDDSYEDTLKNLFKRELHNHLRGIVHGNMRVRIDIIARRDESFYKRDDAYMLLSGRKYTEILTSAWQEAFDEFEDFMSKTDENFYGIWNSTIGTLPESLYFVCGKFLDKQYNAFKLYDNMNKENGAFPEVLNIIDGVRRGGVPTFEDRWVIECFLACLNEERVEDHLSNGGSYNDMPPFPTIHNLLRKLNPRVKNN